MYYTLQISDHTHPMPAARERVKRNANYSNSDFSRVEHEFETLRENTARQGPILDGLLKSVDAIATINNKRFSDVHKKFGKWTRNIPPHLPMQNEQNFQNLRKLLSFMNTQYSKIPQKLAIFNESITKYDDFMTNATNTFEILQDFTEAQTNFQANSTKHIQNLANLTFALNQTFINHTITYQKSFMQASHNYSLLTNTTINLNRTLFNLTEKFQNFTQTQISTQQNFTNKFQNFTKTAQLQFEKAANRSALLNTTLTKQFHAFKNDTQISHANMKTVLTQIRNETTNLTSMVKNSIHKFEQKIITHSETNGNLTKEISELKNLLSNQNAKFQEIFTRLDTLEQKFSYSGPFETLKNSVQGLTDNLNNIKHMAYETYNNRGSSSGGGFWNFLGGIFNFGAAVVNTVSKTKDTIVKGAADTVKSVVETVATGTVTSITKKSKSVLTKINPGSIRKNAPPRQRTNRVRPSKPKKRCTRAIGGTCSTGIHLLTITYILTDYFTTFCTIIFYIYTIAITYANEPPLQTQ